MGREYRIGVQTRGLLEHLAPEIGFRMAKEAGFSCFDFNLDVFLQNFQLYAGQINDFFKKSEEELLKEFQIYADLSNQYGITFSQMHAPYPVRVEGFKEQNRFMIEEVMPKSLAIAELLKIPYVIIHPFKMQYKHSVEREREANMEFFEKLIPLAKKYNVIICLENLYEGRGQRKVEGVCANPVEAIWYIDRLNEIAGAELFGFCLDTGHMQLAKRKAYDTVIALGKRLKALHLHENDGYEDLHQMPFTFGNKSNRGLDWQGLMRGLSEVNYQGALSFETFPCVSSFPVDMKQEVLNAICLIGKGLCEMEEVSCV